MIISVILFIYLLTIAYSILGIRTMLRYYEWSVDGFVVFMSLIPAVNVVWGSISFIDVFVQRLKRGKHNHNTSKLWSAICRIYKGN